MSWSGSVDGVARELLSRVGYRRDHVQRDVTSLGGSGLTLDLVAYGRELGPFDASTATIAIQFVSDARNVATDVRSRLAEAALAMSVPALIVADNRWWSLHAVTGLRELSLLRELQWVDDIGDLREYLSPGALIAAKLGTRQLSLFPAAVIVSDQGRRLREEALGPRVKQALYAAESTLPLEDAAAKQTRAARLVIGALTVVVLRDKPSRSADRPLTSPTADVLVNRAATMHPRQFDWLAAEGTAERDRLEALVDEFIDIDFGSVEPHMLSVLYENVLVDESMKRKVGAHYTPPGLAQRLLKWLPIEEIAPADRRIYDPTCGSGTLLVAAHDRIRELQSPALDTTESHQDLVTRIRGGDIDPVAVSIANLSLFLNALPAGNGWQIDQADVFGTRSLPDSPTILVANPPWQFQRKKHHDDLAQQVLMRLLDWSPPGGLLGVIMPAGWMSWTSPAAVRSRTALFEKFDVFEAWQLPGGTFDHADIGAAVILGRRKGGLQPRPTKSIRRRITQRNKLGEFYSTGAAQTLMTDLDTDSLGDGPLRSWFKSNGLSAFTVADYARSMTGPQPESPAKLAKRRSPLESNAALIKWDEVPAYSDVQGAASRPVHFPSDMQNGSLRGSAVIGRPKVLFSAGKRPDRPWRLKVAIDTDGKSLPKNTVKVLLPHIRSNSAPLKHRLSDRTVLYGLFAYMASGFVSAWLDEAVATRNLGIEVIASIPAPTPSLLARLARFGQALPATSEKSATLRRIDQLVWESFAIPDSLRDQLISRLNEGEAPEGGHRYVSNPSVAGPNSATANEAPTQHVTPMWRAGTVGAINAQTVELDIPGVTATSPAAVTIPCLMPAALLVPDRVFSVLDAGLSLNEMQFRFDELAYLTDDDVLTEISNIVDAHKSPPTTQA